MLQEKNYLNFTHQVLEIFAIEEIASYKAMIYHTKRIKWRLAR